MWGGDGCPPDDVVVDYSDDSDAWNPWSSAYRIAAESLPVPDNLAMEASSYALRLAASGHADGGLRWDLPDKLGRTLDEPAPGAGFPVSLQEAFDFAVFYGYTWERFAELAESLGMPRPEGQFYGLAELRSGAFRAGIRYQFFVYPSPTAAAYSISHVGWTAAFVS